MLLNSKIARDFNDGIHEVRIIAYGETNPSRVVKKNGEVLDYKATFWLKLQDINNKAIDTYRFFFETVTGEDGLPAITELDQHRFNAMIAKLLRQIPEEDTAGLDELGAIVETLKTKGTVFKTLVTTNESEDGRRWKNFTFDMSIMDMLD